MKYLIFPLLFLLIAACNPDKKSPASTTAAAAAGNAAQTSDTDPFDLNSYTLESIPGSEAQAAVKKSEEGVVREMGEVLDGKRTGAWTIYGDDPVRPRKIINYVDGIRNGLYIEMNQAGYIDVITYYKDNKLHGPWAKYRFGRPLETAEYQNGELHGTLREFQLRDGKIIKEVHYKNGKLDGSFRHFNDKGEVVLEYQYKDGEKVGEGVLNPKDGNK